MFHMLKGLEEIPNERRAVAMVVRSVGGGSAACALEHIEPIVHRGHTGVDEPGADHSVVLEPRRFGVGELAKQLSDFQSSCRTDPTDFSSQGFGPDIDNCRFVVC